MAGGVSLHSLAGHVINLIVGAAPELDDKAGMDDSRSRPVIQIHLLQLMRSDVN